MISAEKKGNAYLIRFRGKKQQFNEYINKVMKLPNKSWDFDNRCWSIPLSDLKALESKFKDITFLDETKTDSAEIVYNQKIEDYDDMGKSMKLTPYDYQKEAIKFGLDQNNILIVYPCGSGSLCI